MISTQQAHPPLISEADFVRAQRVNAITPSDNGKPRTYRLTGLVICGLCGRRAEGHWANRRARYRCRHGATSSGDATGNRIPTLYLREDHLMAQAAAQLPDVNPEDVPALMKARQMTIVCTSMSVVVEDPAAKNAKRGPTRPDPADDPRARDTDQAAETRKPPPKSSTNVKNFGGG